MEREIKDGDTIALRDDREKQQMKREAREVRKSKKIVRAIPSTQLSKAQQVIQHFLLFKIGRECWDYENNKVKDNAELTTSFTLRELKDIFKEVGDINRLTISNSIVPISKLGYAFSERKNTKIFNVFSWVGYDSENETYGAKLNKDFLNELVSVKNNFISLGLGELLNFKSKYTSPVYDYLKSFRSGEGFINKNIDIGFLRELTFTTDKYKMTKDFRKSVLVKIYEDLKNSSLKLSYTEIRKETRGNKLIGVNFKSNSQMSIFDISQEKDKKAKATQEAFNKLWNDF